jgi:hypothetical protein
MDTDSRERTVGQIKGFIENLGNRSAGKQENYSNSSAGYKTCIRKFVQYIILPALAIANARPYVYIKKNPARYFDPDGPASPSSGQFDSSSGGGVG